MFIETYLQYLIPLSWEIFYILVYKEQGNTAINCD